MAICEECSKEFTHRQKGSKYCSPSCCMKKYHKDNREKLLARKKELYLQNKESFNSQAQQWYQENKDIRQKLNRDYRHTKNKSILVGDKEFYHLFMKEIYSLRKIRTELTGIEWHVDHIVPLKGKNVCGLHTPNNMQLLTAVENKQKFNSFEETNACAQ